MISLFKTFSQPRTLLILMSAIGGLFLLYVLVAASVSNEGRPGAGGADVATGEMAAFTRSEFRRPTPEVILSSDDGTVFLPELTGGGQVVLVNLWASWCAPCIEELPSLVALSARADVDVVPVAMERRSAAQDRLLERAGVAGAFPVLSDPELGLMRAYGGDLSLPLTIVYDRNGREVGRLAGAADWSSPEAQRLVARIAEDGAGR